MPLTKSQRTSNKQLLITNAQHLARIRFSDEWNEKVENWVEENSAMIARYDALRNYRKLIDQMDRLVPFEQHQFYASYGREDEIGKELPQGYPSDDVFANDWPHKT